MPALASEPVQVRLRRIQTALGVQVDGVLGPETLSAKLTGSTRTQMAKIKQLVPGGSANLDAIADQIESMVRLIDGSSRATGLLPSGSWGTGPVCMSCSRPGDIARQLPARRVVSLAARKGRLTSHPLYRRKKERL
jgi:hypothetical protein